jgi:predicted PurR-regulated permease PerM
LKPLIIIIVLTTLIVTGGYLTIYALGSESQRLDNNLSALESDIEKQNWAAAMKKIEEFHSKWDKTSSLWSMLIDHFEIDNIELALSQLISYVKTQDKNEALSKMSSLKTLIKHIPEKESFNLKNVF